MATIAASADFRACLEGNEALISLPSEKVKRYPKVRKTNAYRLLQIWRCGFFCVNGAGGVRTTFSLFTSSLKRKTALQTCWFFFAVSIFFSTNYTLFICQSDWRVLVMAPQLDEWPVSRVRRRAGGQFRCVGCAALHTYES